jgi:aspartate/glutamate racemase
MTTYTILRRTQSWYGESIGILILDAAYPCIPGNVGNATTFLFPVRYQEVRGASLERLINRADPSLAESFVEAAIELRNRGVKAITGACGFMAFFQREVARAVDIPVFLSSLMQVPFIHAISGRPVGIITANAARLTTRHFEAIGVASTIPVVIGDMYEKREFREAILEEKGTLDSDQIEREAVEVAMDLKRRNEDVGAILLECSDLPPYAHAIQAATQLPVFDFTTMINYVHAALLPRRYAGVM